MMSRQLLAAFAVVALAAATAWWVSRDATAALLMTVLGTAAVLLAVAPARSAADGNTAPQDAPEPLLSEITDAIAEPLLLVNGQTVERANAAARALLGEHLIGEDVRVAIRHPAAAERLLRDDGGDDDTPVGLVGLGQRDQHWEMRVRRLDAGRRLIHLVDRTESRAADRIRVDFVANASHELRTPLAAILGFIETLRDDAGEDPVIRARFLGVMDDEARRMQRLVDDLISLSRIEADKFRTPEQPVDLAELLELVHSELSATDPARGGDVSITVGGPLVVTGDRAQLSQLMHNVVGNAMKYGRLGTPVTVELKVEGGGVTLTITDQGDGIPTEHLPRLTERFYRVDPGRSRAMGGTGLGLAIVKHIVERHRGRLSIASKVGVGTTVTVQLPEAVSSSGNESATGLG